ncbi:hypothetical protein HDU76_010625, partial [Blyttiomyces sp. JEL0837]
MQLQHLSLTSPHPDQQQAAMVHEFMMLQEHQRRMSIISMESNAGCPPGWGSDEQQPGTAPLSDIYMASPPATPIRRFSLAAAAQMSMMPPSIVTDINTRNMFRSAESSSPSPSFPTAFSEIDMFGQGTGTSFFGKTDPDSDLYSNVLVDAEHGGDYQEQGYKQEVQDAQEDEVSNGGGGDVEEEQTSQHG